MSSSVESIRLVETPEVQYVLRLADTVLIHAQRLSEWSGHGPVLEEDIAFANLALDLLGQARALLTLAGRMEARARDVPAEQAYDEDALAFLRDERQFFNLTLVEQPSRRASAHSPGGDFADAVLRNLLVSTWCQLHWQALAAGSSEPELSAIAAKASKETRYHQRHAADWVVRLGDGSEESARRMRAALERAWPCVPEMLQGDGVDEAAARAGLGPARGALASAWRETVGAVLAQARLEAPAEGRWLSTGTQGRHSEHFGFILAEMQSLQRAFPGGRW